MTGYRSGAIISMNEDVMQTLKKMRTPMGVGTPSFIQEGAIEALSDDEHVVQHREEYLQRRDFYKAIFERLGFKVWGADAGFYLWMSHPKYKTSQEAFDYALEKGYIVTPGTAFGTDGEGYVRAVYCVPRL